MNVHDGDTVAVVHQEESANATAFLDFLRLLKERHPNRMIALVLDNARIHHARMVKDFLREEGQCFHFLYLPPYSPQLNPIERLWKWLKDTVITNAFHKDRHEILQAVQRLIHYIPKRPEDVLRRLECAV
ncbi:IS630 family transposase [Geobacillus sp. LEMMY01]|nr:IS630 family transposase [Geobacillus sp. LEMMY01]